MKWALGEWIPLKEMQKEASSERFINTKFGDVYSKVES